jgi:hypothetical protein
LAEAISTAIVRSALNMRVVVRYKLLVGDAAWRKATKKPTTADERIDATSDHAS